MADEAEDKLPHQNLQRAAFALMRAESCGRTFQRLSIPRILLKAPDGSPGELENLAGGSPRLRALAPGFQDGTEQPVRFLRGFAPLSEMDEPKPGSLIKAARSEPSFR